MNLCFVKYLKKDKMSGKLGLIRLFVLTLRINTKSLCGGTIIAVIHCVYLKSG